MTTPISSFHLFGRLPTELRLHIWQYCLPYRVVELDYPLDTIVYSLDREGPDNLLPSPCSLRHTTFQNGRPPLISRVCRESRGVATRSGGFITEYDTNRLSDTEWSSTFDYDDSWEDKTHGAPHLNWTAGYELEHDYHGYPLNCMIWESRKISATPSIMLELLYSNTFGPRPYPFTPDGRFQFRRRPNEKAEFINAYKQLPSWLVVTRIIVVHSHLDSAAATGLFGLLGDAPVQIVPVSEEAKVASFYDLAERCERGKSVIISQDFRQIPVDEMRQYLRCTVLAKFASEDLAAIMHPAIMFRLCTQMCNHSVEVQT